MYNNREIQNRLFQKVFSPEQISNWVSSLISKDNNPMFSMIEKNTYQFIGNIQVINRTESIGEVIISIMPSKQGKHYGTESIKSIVRYGYENLHLKGFELYVYKDNSKAIHCYENAGFEVIGDGITNEDVKMVLKK